MALSTASIELIPGRVNLALTMANPSGFSREGVSFWFNDRKRKQKMRLLNMRDAWAESENGNPAAFC
jgi:hypothetical protein